jgi:hypothetical protein
MCIFCYHEKGERHFAALYVPICGYLEYDRLNFPQCSNTAKAERFGPNRVMVRAE